MQYQEHRVAHETFVLPVRWLPRRLLGKGAYGTVVEALDRETNEKVALKKKQLSILS
jgi:hypothetical protein